MKKLLLIMFLASAVMGQANHTGWPLELLSWNVNKAYPGIEYNYRLGIKGGEYPYTFALRHGPEGMIVDSTGALIWTPASATTDSVRVVVKDMLNDSLVVEYGITATTTGFYFVDSATGSNSNAGTEDSPWATMAYAATTADSSSYVYVKKGTYSETFTMTTTGCGRFYAYPGDSVIVIGAGTGTASFSVVGKNRIFQGFVFDGRGLRWIFSVAGYINDIIWRKNEMRNVFDTTSANPCFIFFWDQGTPYTNMVIQDNIFHDLCDTVKHHGASVTYYAVVNSLYEDNHAYDIDGDGVHEKMRGKRNTFRNNIFNDIRMYQAIRLNSNPSSDSTEICYNLIYNCTQGIQIGSNGSYVANIFVHHNTCLNPIVLANLVIAGANSNNINIYKNIIGNGTQYTYSLGSWPDGFTDKVAIDSNIVYGLSDLTKVVGTAKQLNWAQWQDSGFDVNSKAIQLTFDFDGIPILDDSLSSVYGHFADEFTYTTPEPEPDPPTITIQPASDTVSAGQSATFFVTASGSGLTYQWFRNDSLLAGENNDTLTYTSRAGLGYTDTLYCNLTTDTTISTDTVTLTVNELSHQRIWSSGGSTDMNDGNNYTPTGPLLTTDTLIFNGTSVVNATATANLSVAHVDIQSTYSGNWVMTGYSLTLTNGGLLRSGSGTFTLGTALTFNGDGKLYTNATSGANNNNSCVVTFNGNDTVDINKTFPTRGIVINGTVTNVGSSFFMVEATSSTETDQPFYIGPAGVYTGTGALQIRANKDCLVISKHPTGVFNATGEISIMSTNSTDNITIRVPAIDIPSNLVMSCVWGGALATFDLQGSINCNTLEMRVSTLNVNPFTFNTNGYNITANTINIGTQKDGVKCYVNFGNSTVYTNTFTTQQYQADSTILTCDGTVFDYVTWNHGTYERIDGTYTRAPPHVSLSTDTLKLNAKHTGTTQWLQNGSVIGSGSGVSLNADSAFYAGTKIEAVTGSNKSTWQFKASGNKRSINFK